MYDNSEVFLKQNTGFGGLSDVVMAHPMISGNVVLPTEAIRQLCLEVSKTILLRYPGLFYTSRTGAGKTCAINYMKDYLKREFSNLVVIHHVGKNYEKYSEREFSKSYLLSAGSINLRGETQDLKTRLFRVLRQLTHESGHDMVILLIDEAQNMNLDEFAFLEDIANELMKEKLNLITVMMAREQDFSRTLESIRYAGRLELSSRFLARKKTFYGFKNEDDLKSICMLIDVEPSPHNTEITWTQFFVPLAYGNGFRLADHTHEMIQTLYERAAENAREFPVHQVFLALRQFLLYCNARDSLAMSFSTDLWRTVVADVGVVFAASVDGRSSEFF